MQHTHTPHILTTHKKNIYMYKSYCDTHTKRRQHAKTYTCALAPVYVHTHTCTNKSIHSYTHVFTLTHLFRTYIFIGKTNLTLKYNSTYVCTDQKHVYIHILHMCAFNFHMRLCMYAYTREYCEYSNVSELSFMSCL